MRRSSTYRHANPTYLQMGAARHQHEHVRNRSVFQSARRMVKVGADTRDAPVLRLLQCGHMSCTQRQLLVHAFTCRASIVSPTKRRLTLAAALSENCGW